MIKRGIIVLSLLVVLLLITACPAPVEPVAPKPEVFHFKFGATSVRSGLYANTVAMAGIINKAYPGEIVVTVVETGGYLENLERLRKGLVHAGAASTGAAAASYLGIMDWEGKPDKNLRSLWGGYFTPIHIVATKASGITTLEGFTGRPFASNPGTTSGWHIEYFFKALDIKPAYKAMGMGASADAMKAGTVDGWYKAGFKDAMIMDIEAAREITVVPVTPEHMARAEKLQPGLHRSMMIEAGHFKAVKAPQLSYAYVVSDFVRADVPETIVYKIVKAIYENRKELVAPLAMLREGKFDLMFKNMIDYGLKVPLHPGAVKLFTEKGYKIPAELMPPKK